MKTGKGTTESVSGCRFPGYAQKDGLILHFFLTAFGPYFLRDEIGHADRFTTPPNTGCGVEGHGLRFILVSISCLGDPLGDNRSFVAPDLDFQDFPYQTITSAMAGLIFKKQNMIFGGKNPGSPVVPGILVLIVGREYGNGRCFGIGWQKTMGMHDRT